MTKRRGPGRPKGPETAQLSVRLSVDLIERVRAEATEGRSLVWVVSDLLERGLDAKEKERGRKRR